MRTIAILAAYNLQDSIGDIVKETAKYVDEVIVVSDASSDKTNEMARAAGAKCPEHTMTRGKGFAVRKGIDFSRSMDSGCIVLMDADGQHLPEEIPVLVKAVVEEDADMVVGSRMLGTLKTSAINRFGNLVLKTISFLVTFRWMTDTESGFRAFKTGKLYELRLEAMSYEIESELLLRSLFRNYKVVEVPITVPKAVPGVTVMDGVKMGIYKIKLGLKHVSGRLKND
ncbi:MAG: glycosyltransferase family 2 protein [Thermoplasmatota archaeon]